MIYKEDILCWLYVLFGGVIVLGLIVALVAGPMYMELAYLRRTFPDRQFRVHWWWGCQVLVNDRWISIEYVVLRFEPSD
ncbi:MAG TPA: hypothetical protein VM537_30285 [Anaerolineae bacterium]|nr:hypothetical protein [Anaerolineae bacterium]